LYGLLAFIETIVFARYLESQAKGQVSEKKSGDVK